MLAVTFPNRTPQGNVETAFTQADNRNIVATDTVKNTVYILARRHQFSSIEEFGVILGK
jgi:urate oxidase